MALYKVPFFKLFWIRYRTILLDGLVVPLLWERDKNYPYSFSLFFAWCYMFPLHTRLSHLFSKLKSPRSLALTLGDGVPTLWSFGLFFSAFFHLYLFWNGAARIVHCVPNEALPSSDVRLLPYWPSYFHHQFIGDGYPVVLGRFNPSLSVPCRLGPEDPLVLFVIISCRGVCTTCYSFKGAHCFKTVSLMGRDFRVLFFCNRDVCFCHSILERAQHAAAVGWVCPSHKQDLI